MTTITVSELSSIWTSNLTSEEQTSLVTFLNGLNVGNDGVPLTDVDWNASNGPIADFAQLEEIGHSQTDTLDLAQNVLTSGVMVYGNSTLTVTDSSGTHGSIIAFIEQNSSLNLGDNGNDTVYLDSGTVTQSTNTSDTFYVSGGELTIVHSANDIINVSGGTVSAQGQDTINETGGNVTTGPGNDVINISGGVLNADGQSENITQTGGTVYAGNGTVTVNLHDGTFYEGGINDTVNMLGGTLFMNNNISHSITFTSGDSGTVNMGAGSSQSVTVDAGDSATINGGSGANQLITDNSIGDTIHMGSGNSQTVDASHGSDSLIYGGSGSGDIIEASNNFHPVDNPNYINQIINGGPTPTGNFFGDAIVEGSGDFQTVTGIGASIDVTGGSGQGDNISLSGANDTVFGGSGINQTIKATGMSSIIQEGTGNNQSATGGALAQLFGGSGSGDVLTDSHTLATFTDGTGLNQTINATGSNAQLNLGNGAGTETVVLGAKNDVVDIALATSGQALTVNISGIDKTTEIDFGETAAEATITTNKAAQTTHIVFTDGLTVNLTGIHDAVYFNGDLSVHYI